MKSTKTKHARKKFRTENPENTTLDTIYLVNNSNQKVTLEIIIGAPGQTSNSLIRLDDETPIADSHAGSFEETPIDSNKNLQGKTLWITTTISDTSRETNYTEMIIRLRGGVSFREYHLSKTVNREGNSAPYLCAIEFFKT